MCISDWNSSRESCVSATKRFQLPLAGFGALFAATLLALAPATAANASTGPAPSHSHGSAVLAVHEAAGGQLTFARGTTIQAGAVAVRLSRQNPNVSDIA